MKKSQFYSHLKINKSKRIKLFFTVFLYFFICTSLLFFEILSDGFWMIALLKTTLISIFIVMIPETETWEYRPWQSKPQVYEQHFQD